MGLDAVELVMDVEDHFGISIQTSEAERIRTVGDLVALIQSRIEAAHLATCPTLASFLRLRSSVREIAADDRLRIRTGTRVVDVLNQFQRKRLWKQLDDFLGSAPPNLRRPPLLRKLVASIVFLTFATAVALAAVVEWAILPLTLAVAAILTLFLHLTTVPFRHHPPDALSTFGAIAQRIAGVAVATKQLHLANNDAILNELRPIVVDDLGVDAAEVVLNARFIEDLGME